MEQNQTSQTPEKKGILDQLKGIGIMGYLCICVVVKGIVEIIKAVTKK
jgi:hypothetical protein